MELKYLTPILRIFDVTKAREFYIDYLGFKLDWEHRFAEGMPLYMQVSRDNVVLHLSEHHGDCCPGSAMRVLADDLDKLHEELHSRNYPYVNPEIEDMPWGTRDLTVKDPFGNRITFSNG